MTGISILLLDGEPMLAQTTALMLTKRGGRVSTAATLEAALDVAGERPFDVAVVDLPPGAPGAGEILQAMRERGCLPRRVIICGGAADASLHAQVIEKPFPFDRLLQAVFGPATKRRLTRSGVFPKVPGATGLRARTSRRHARGPRDRG